MLQQSYVKNFSNFLRWNKQNMNWIDWILISAKSTTNFNYVGFHEDCPREGKGPWKYKCKLKWINPIYSWPTKMTLNRLKKPTLCFPTPLSHSHICSLRHIEEPNSFSPFSIFTLKLGPPFSKFFFSRLYKLAIQAIHNWSQQDEITSVRRYAQQRSIWVLWVRISSSKIVSSFQAFVDWIYCYFWSNFVQFWVPFYDFTNPNFVSEMSW